MRDARAFTEMRFVPLAPPLPATFAFGILSNINGNVSHVSEIFDFWPVLSEDVGGVFICFGKGNRGESVPFGGELESSNSAEQVEMS